ncbi:MAG TPA: hypothetical protein VMH28_07775 [Candidatus Acidoferrales bacterium]|nr:hypothetical protein [Candidatus Acidoferrales bacterium]
MRLSALLILCTALPAMADTRFQIRRMTRDDVPPGKGQCDIRLQVDNQVEVSVRGDMVSVRTLAGQDARDDGSECNAPLPNRDVQGFNFEVKDSRGDIRLLAEPTRRNDFAAIVAIRDGSGGFGRYHFRLTWAMTGSDYRGDRPPGRRDDFDHPPAASGFSWNNAINFHGQGQGRATWDNAGDLRLFDCNIDIDRGGRIVAVFRAERGRTLTFRGQVMTQDGGRWKADVANEEGRLRGPLWFSVDDRRQVNTISIEATDGRERMRLNWDRR